LTSSIRERDEEGSTTDYNRHSEMSLWAREIILNLPGAFARMAGLASLFNLGGLEFAAQTSILRCQPNSVRPRRFGPGRSAPAFIELLAGSNGALC